MPYSVIPWERIPQRTRRLVIKGLWFITWLLLLAGLYDRVFYEYVVVFSLLHAVLFFILLGFRVQAFPVQVRIAYLAWVAVGTYAPYMVILLYITMIGLATNLFLGYCPLARIMYLMPWNREEPFSLELLKRVFLAAPVSGQFKLKSE